MVTRKKNMKKEKIKRKKIRRRRRRIGGEEGRGYGEIENKNPKVEIL